MNATGQRFLPVPGGSARRADVRTLCTGASARRARVAAGLVGIVTAAVVGAGCDEECVSNQDCPSGRFQCIDNTCVLPPEVVLPDMGQVDPIDLGFPDVPDLGFIDRGVMVPADTGMMIGDAGDGGTDAADVGRPDAADSGEIDLVTDTEALVQVSIIDETDDPGPVTPEARIVDYSATGRQVMTRTQDGCVITERPAATPVGLTAMEIQIRNGSTTIDLEPTTSPGIFRDVDMVDATALLASGNTLNFTIVSSGGSGTLGGATAATGRPVNILNEPATPGSTLNFFVFNLAGPAASGANRFEIYDANRTTVVVCPMTPASAGLPAFIAGLFRSGSLATLEVRQDQESTVSVPVIDRGSLPVTFRASRGLRYFILIP